ncbi:putative bacteriochlorophyll 4-vinyl reductase [Umbribacter vaginalis]|nr:putative bacteriochlorophyll 4-vinyl reductase [Coriobacteriales bacterium DNF00809]
MNIIEPQSSGDAVEDVQMRLVSLGLLTDDNVTGTFDETTARAIAAFRSSMHLPQGTTVDEKVWNALVDASYRLGDRTLFLRLPYFHGNDVVELQKALGALGFTPGKEDGMFGPHTEDALRKFQLNLGLPSDGIAGAYTYRALHNLHFSWEGKHPLKMPVTMGFARASEALERSSFCFFGTCEFTRDVARRMANLATATNPQAHAVCADELSVAPPSDMILVHIVLCDEPQPSDIPQVSYDETLAPERFASHVEVALRAAAQKQHKRVALVLPGTCWMQAGEQRTAQHYAISLLDALCAALCA